MAILRWFLNCIALAGLVVLLAGIVGFPLVSKGQLGPEYSEATATVESVQWPNYTLRREDHTWTIQRWAPLPWWSTGQTVHVHIKNDNSELVPVFGIFHPLLLLLAGFLMTMVSLTIRLFLPEPELTVPPAPSWPIVLREDPNRAWTALIIGVGVGGWVLYDWIWPAPGADRVDVLADAGRLLLAFCIGAAGLYWITKRVRVTPDEIVESSVFREKRVKLSTVRFATTEIIRSHERKRPMIGTKVVLRDAQSQYLYEFSSVLTPVADRESLFGYLRDRFRPSPQ